MTDDEFKNGVVVAAANEGSIFGGDEIDSDCPRKRNSDEEESCRAEMPDTGEPALFCL